MILKICEIALFTRATPGSSLVRINNKDDSNDTPQPICEFREADLKFTYRLWVIVLIVLMSLFSSAKTYAD